MTYQQFQENKFKHDGLCIEYLAKTLCSALLVMEWEAQDSETQADLLVFAMNTYKSMNEAGWDMMFNEKNKFSYIIT